MAEPLTDPIPALARIIHFACVAVDGEYALKHQPTDHERALRVAWSHADPADIDALATRHIEWLRLAFRAAWPNKDEARYLERALMLLDTVRSASQGG